MRVFDRHEQPAGGSEEPAAPGTPATLPGAPPAPHWTMARLLLSPWTVSALLLLAAVTPFAWRRWHPPLDATRAYSRIRRRLTRAGLRLSPAVPPLAVQAQAARRFPAAATPLAQIVGLYLGESFGGRRLAENELAALRAALTAAEAQVR
jgi:Domain of unknown function (DUF4129)